MTRIDKLLYEAKVLDVRTREYKPCFVVEKADGEKWTVRGNGMLFDSEREAVNFCEEQAAGRPIGIVIDDIPHILPDGDYVDTRSFLDADAIKELLENGVKGSS